MFTEQKRDYGRIAARAKGAAVLDFGGHCGFFNVFLARNHRPRSIVTIEPDPRLLPILRRNCMRKSRIVSAAVVDEFYPDDEISLYLGRTFSAANSVEKFRGREEIRVPVVRFGDVVEDIEFIKCDCEGGEYGLDWTDLPLSVHSVAIEFHFFRPAWEQGMYDIDDALLDQGFEHVKRPKLNTFQKINTGLYVRDGGLGG